MPDFDAPATDACDLAELRQRLTREPAVLVTVARAEGSTPRERGAWMAVLADGAIGSVGGGRVEFEAVARARRLLAPSGAQAAETVRYPLGPSLGQCCGGVMHLRFERVDSPADLAGRLQPGSTVLPLVLFGGGHVGTAIVRLAGTLPMAVTWIDSRDEVFPSAVPANVVCEHSDPVQAAVPSLPAGAAVVVMSYSHAEDLDIVAACLQRQRQQGDLAYIGLIGSRTKWAVFSRRLTAKGYSDADLAQVTCPIGVPGISGKQPAVVAVAVVAQLLKVMSADRAGSGRA